MHRNILPYMVSVSLLFVGIARSIAIVSGRNGESQVLLDRWEDLFNNIGGSLIAEGNHRTNLRLLVRCGCNCFYVSEHRSIRYIPWCSGSFLVSQSESWVGKVSSFNPCGPERVLDKDMFAFKKGWCSHTNWIRWKCSASRVGWVEKFGSQLLALGSGDSFGSMHNKHTAYVLQQSFPSIMLAIVGLCFQVVSDLMTFFYRWINLILNMEIWLTMASITHRNKLEYEAWPNVWFLSLFRCLSAIRAISLSKCHNTAAQWFPFPSGGVVDIVAGGDSYLALKYTLWVAISMAGWLLEDKTSKSCSWIKWIC